MTRILPWLILTGCAPVEAVIVSQTSPLERCDAGFEATEAWSVGLEDYGMLRGASGFGVDGETFVHTSGVYDTVTRTLDARTGELVAERSVRRTDVNQNIYAPPDSRSPSAWSPDGSLLARGLADDTIVVERLCDGELVVVLEVDPTLTPLYGEEAAPASLFFSPEGDALVATYEGGVQAYLVP